MKKKKNQKHNKTTKIETSLKGLFHVFPKVFFFFYVNMSDKGQFGILLKKRQKHVTHLETRERHPLTLDDACITLFCWKCNHILFLSVWRVSLVVVQFVLMNFFPLSFLSHLLKITA